MAKLREDIQELWIAIKYTFVDYLETTFKTLNETWPVILILVALLGMGIAFSDPPPPKHLIMATGYTGSSVNKIGQDYAKFLADKGIHLELVNTSDSGENLRRILDPQDPTQVTFMPTIMVKPDQVKGILSLGEVGTFPVFIFTRGFTANTVNDFIGKRIYVGLEESANYAIALKLLDIMGISNQVTLVSDPLDQIIETIEADKVDVVIVVDELHSKPMLYLADNPDWQLDKTGTSDAISRLLPEFKKSTMPKNGLSFLLNKPSEPLDLLTSNVELVIKDNLHPAIQMLLLQATKEINSQRSFFQVTGTTSSTPDGPIPPSPEAKLFYEKGTPFLMNYLPFWLAEMLYRLFYLLLPFIIFVYPVFKLLPDLRLKPTKKRFTKIYAELRQIEEEFLVANSLLNLEDCIHKITLLEDDVKAMHVPPKLSSDYFSLRSTIDFFRSTLLTAKEDHMPLTEKGMPSS